jgi:transcriptional regulator with XRE-family HTH domain
MSSSVAGADSVSGALAANLRQRRDAAGLSLAELADLAGIAKGTVAAIEGGQANPTVDTVYALATALGCSMPDLLAGAPDPMLVEHRGPGTLERVGALDVRLLQRFTPNGPVEVYEASLANRRPRSSEPHARGVYEHVWVIAGRVELGPSEDPYELGPGDYVCFAGWREHHYRAIDPEVRMLLMLSYSRPLPEVPVLRHLV